MDKNYTDITVVLDRSGSMSSTKKDMEGGFDTFIADQRKVDGKCNVTLYQFDTVYELVYKEVPVGQVKPLDLQPRGSTALLDALARAINETGARLRAMQPKNRPANTIFIIITDGYENASVEVTRAQVKEMVKHQEDKYNWHFIYLGANQDAIAEGASFGTKSCKTMTFEMGPIGIYNTYSSLSNSVTLARNASASGQSVDQNYQWFSEDDRKNATAKS